MFALEVQLQARKCENHFSVVIVVLQLDIRWHGAGTAGSLDGVGVRLAGVFLEHGESVDGCEGDGMSKNGLLKENCQLTVNLTVGEGVVEPLLEGLELRWEDDVPRHPHDGRHGVVLRHRLRI